MVLSHFQIQKKNEYLFIDNGPYLSSLEHVVEHYKCMPDGLPGPLIHAIPPDPRPPVPDMPSSLFNGNTLQRRSERNSQPKEKDVLSLESRPPIPDMPASIFNGSSLQRRSDRSQDTSASYLRNISFEMDLPSPTVEANSNVLGVAHQEFIPGENVILGEVLGEGEFGAVYEGVFVNSTGAQEPVAIKVIL